MIRLFLFYIKDLFTKPKSGDYISLVRKLDKDRYLCVINGIVRTITTDEYKHYLKTNEI